MARRSPFFPLAGLLVLLLVPGCSKAPEQAAQQGPPPPAGAADIKADMGDHFNKVREIENALIRGDVEAAKEPARWLAEHMEAAGMPPGTEARATEMRAAARAVASANDIGNASIASATLVGGCGSCHATAKVTPKFPDLPPIDKTAKADKKDTTETHMMEHQLAVERMYRGLVAPASDDWRLGAQALKASPLVGKSMPKEVTEEAITAEARIHELADKASAAAEKSVRVTVYGSVVGACASCHGLYGKVWGPGMPKSEKAD